MAAELLDMNIVKKHNAEVVEIVSKTNALDPTYRFIRFWGRIPYYLLDDLIKQFKSKKTLFDPFGGSGSVVFVGMNNGFSNIIYNDLNPSFVFIAKTLYESLDIPKSKIDEDINKLKKILLSSQTILDMSKIDKSHHIYKFAYDYVLTINKNISIPCYDSLGLQDKKLKKICDKIIKTLNAKNNISFSELRRISIKNIKARSKIQSRAYFSFVLNKLIDKKIVKKKLKKDYLIISQSITFPKNTKKIKVDAILDKRLNRKNKKYSYLIKEDVFSYPLSYDNGKIFSKATGLKKIGDLYTTWSKILLSVIWKEIEQFPSKDKRIINLFKLCFLASLYDSSKMQMPHKSGWIIKAFWIPPRFGVKNPIYVFFKKLDYYSKFVYDSLKYKIKKDTSLKFYNKDILNFNEKIKPDVVITHPPYFSTVQYGELSSIWASWLNRKIPFEKEIVQNPRQNKSKQDYLDLLKKSLEKISDLSKKDSDIVLIFQSKNKNDWKLLDNILLESQLVLKQVRIYKRKSCWNSKQLFNIGNYDYAFIFKNNK